jgi:SRSO17 transposase
MVLREAGKGYVLGVTSDHVFHAWGREPWVAGTAETIAQDLDRNAYKRLSAGEGTKGPRVYDWAYLELADLEADEYDGGQGGLWTRGLLIRRNIADGEYAYFTTWCPAGTGIETLVAVEGQRWAIEDSFETAKNELGLDHNETRSWHGWHRHVSLVMLAFAMLAIIRHHANRSAITRTDRHPKKRCCRLRRYARPYPVVGPGNPPRCRTAGTTTHPARLHHCMVTLAAGPPGHC